MSNNRVFIVTGLPRSGTSMVAGILHNLGVNMLRSTTPRKDRHNSKGYFENLSIVNINILNSRTRNFSDILEKAKTPDHIDPDISRRHHTNIIGGLCAKHLIWGVKDPRFCFPFILRDFVEDVEEFTRDIKIIFVARGITSVAKSMSNVILQEENKTIEWKEIHPTMLSLAQIANQTISNLEYESFIISYDSLVDQPNKHVLRLSNFCNFPINDNAVDFVDKSLKRF